MTIIEPPRPRGDRGAASVEMVIATPVAMLLVLLVVQFAVWEHAQHIAYAAAGQALAAARVQHGTAATGREHASDVLAQIGHGLAHPDITVTRTPVRVRVEVTGQAQPVVPFLHLPVHAVAIGPVEHPSTG